MLRWWRLAVRSLRTELGDDKAMPRSGQRCMNEEKAEVSRISVPHGPVKVDKSGSVLVAIHAKPGAKISAITDVSEEIVSVAIAAPASDGEANAELVGYLAKLLQLRKSEVVLYKGSTSRKKMVKILTLLSPEEVHKRLRNAAASN
ncbi:UPF0235 protein C15orf40 homolog [Hemitrygon akajei]|uniref:UPF0235 protein C15orf40 homolog n=1 Tax=Hemitrygon akajei TaxID=2704970 RepID=UPI003BF9EE1E